MLDEDVIRDQPQRLPAANWSDLEIARPSAHISVPASALKHPTLSSNTKGLLGILDGLGHRSTCQASNAELARWAGLTDRQVRRALGDLTSAGYAKRVRRGGYGWSTRLLRRTPPTWAPRWVLTYWLHCDQLSLEHFVLYLAIINNVPQGSLAQYMPPWCAVGREVLAEQTTVKRDRVAGLLDDLAGAGMALVVHREGREKIVYPTVEPDAQPERLDRAACLLALAEQFAAYPDEMRLTGIEAAVAPGDSPAVLDFVGQTSAAKLVATGRSRRLHEEAPA